jgi:hypothetical protein
LQGSESQILCGLSAAEQVSFTKGALTVWQRVSNV